MEARLNEERAAREAAERQVLALKTEKRLLEYRVINAHRTLAHGLGRALIEARSLKGLLALPGRIRRLRIKQKAKRRERVPHSFADNVAAIMRLADPAMDRARTGGIEAAADWVRGEKAEPETKARALAELAHGTLESDPALAARLGEEAAGLAPNESRLFALAVRLRESGMVKAPAAICSAIRAHQPLSQPQLRLCDLLAEDATLLETGVWGATLEEGRLPDARDPALLIVCPKRWTTTPRIAAARHAARAAGWPVSIAAPADPVDFLSVSVLHIFADSLPMACPIVARAREAGCRIIFDMANPPPASLTLPDSEAAGAEAARLKGLRTCVDEIVVRSASASACMKALGISHRTAGEPVEPDIQTVDEQLMAAAMTEYGATAEARTIGCFATLDEDAGLVRCLEAFAALSPGEAEQFLIFGRGGQSAALARKAEECGIAGRVHFIGLPPPQRWPALLAGLKLAVCPRQCGEALGSEIPMILVQALGRALPLLASPAAWASQAGWQRDSGAVLEAEGDWAAQMRQLLETDSAVQRSAPAGDPSHNLYDTLRK